MFFIKQYETNEELLNYLKSKTFLVLLAHEVFHWEQTIEYGVPTMAKFVKEESEGKYSQLQIELEACVFMVLKDAYLNYKKINSFDELENYTHSLSSSFLKTAKTLILNNLQEVKIILEQNKSFLTEAQDLIEQDNLNFMFDLVATPVNKPLGYWKDWFKD